MKRKAILLLFFASLYFMIGCSTIGAEEFGNVSSENNSSETVETVSAENQSDMFTDRDLEIGYDEETSSEIILSGDGASSDSDAVEISGSTVTIIDEGTYILSGNLDDGMVIINAEDTDKVQIVLDGVRITNSDSAAVYVKEADKVFITTTGDSENTLMNGGEYVEIDDNNIDAVIFSKADLTLNGAGILNISAKAGHGIVSKDDLVLTSGTYDITAESHGLSGKDSIRIANGSYTISAGKDGMHAENTDDNSLGFLYIAGGMFVIDADGDGISAGGDMQIEGGDYTITTGEGSASVTMTTETVDNNRPGGEINETTVSEEEDDDTVSQKGVKADGMITVTDGSFIIDTSDDSVHAGGDIFVSGGEYELKSGDDAIHSDEDITVDDGTFSISYCYEGIEGLSITINGGTFEIYSEDDGLNAAGGADSSGFAGGGPGQEQFSSESESYITINGGTFVIVSVGDSVDSNGDLTINGGTLDLTCNGNGDTALDCDGTFSNNGGDVTTNDGSENNPGQMAGPGGKGTQKGVPDQGNAEKSESFNESVNQIPAI